MPRIKQVLIAVDQLANTLAGGWADETLSARCWRLRHHRRWGFLQQAIDLLFFWELHHCHESYLNECFRRQLPSHYREQA